MNSSNEKTKTSKPEKAPANEAQPGEKATNKVPETAENFEHVLRRLVIEKNKSKSQS